MSIVIVEHPVKGLDPLSPLVGLPTIETEIERKEKERCKEIQGMERGREI